MGYRQMVLRYNNILIQEDENKISYLLNLKCLDYLKRLILKSTLNIDEFLSIFICSYK